MIAQSYPFEQTAQATIGNCDAGRCAHWRANLITSGDKGDLLPLSRYRCMPILMARGDRHLRVSCRQKTIAARRMNVSPSTVHQWESGQKRPSRLATKLLSVVEKHGISVLD